MIVAGSKSLYFVSKITIKGNTCGTHVIVDVPNVTKADLGDACLYIKKVDVTGHTDIGSFIHREY